MSQCLQIGGHHRLQRLVAVEPDEEFPGTKSSYFITKGCPRRKNVIEYFYHPDRLNYPRKRSTIAEKTIGRKFHGNRHSPRSVNG